MKTCWPWPSRCANSSTGKEYAGYELCYWEDRSVDVEDRMNMLIRNGLQGLALVFIVLAIFLDLRLAFWVALGIPISVLGAGAFLYATGQTLNMLSMFAFLMALGIVVDDAIVIGENIYRHREMGKKPVRRRSTAPLKCSRRCSPRSARRSSPSCR